MSSARILLLFAHPALRRSRVNARLAAAVRDLDGVTFHDLYETYPDFAIDVDREQDLLRAHDTVVFQHPFYWYSAPAIVKEWLDLVLEHGFAYGRNGTELQGKSWLQAITTGGRNDQYGAMGSNRFTVMELLRPFEATANLCGMRWLEPFIVHSALAPDGAALAGASDAYRARLLALTSDLRRE